MQQLMVQFIYCMSPAATVFGIQMLAYPLQQDPNSVTRDWLIMKFEYKGQYVFILFTSPL